MIVLKYGCFQTIGLQEGACITGLSEKRRRCQEPHQGYIAPANPPCGRGTCRDRASSSPWCDTDKRNQGDYSCHATNPDKVLLHPIGATYHQGIHAPGPLFRPIRKRPGTSIPYHVKYQARIWFTSALWDLIIELPSTCISRCSEFCTIPAIIIAI